MEAHGKACPWFDTPTAEENVLCLGFSFRIAQSSNADEYINLLNY